MALLLGFLFANLSTPCSCVFFCLFVFLFFFFGGGGGCFFKMVSISGTLADHSLPPRSQLGLGRAPPGRFQMPTWSGELEACWLVK